MLRRRRRLRLRRWRGRMCFPEEKASELWFGGLFIYADTSKHFERGGARECREGARRDDGYVTARRKQQAVNNCQVPTIWNRFTSISPATPPRSPRSKCFELSAKIRGGEGAPRGDAHVTASPHGLTSVSSATPQRTPRSKCFDLSAKIILKPCVVRSNGRDRALRLMFGPTGLTKVPGRMSDRGVFPHHG